MGLLLSPVLASGRPRLVGPLLGVYLLLGGWWAYDTIQDLREHHQAGEITRTLITQTKRARSGIEGDRPLFLVNLPAMWGSEKDISFCNWGSRAMLRRGGLTGPLSLFRTIPYNTNTSIPLISHDLLVRRAREESAIVLVFDGMSRKLKPWDGLKNTK